MNNELVILILTATSIGFIHTILGPDHYLPFIMMNKAGKWSNKKTFWVTILSGLGHVGSSVLIGLIGILLGIAVNKLQFFESVRGNFAAWLLIGFGFGYTVWGLRKVYRKKPHIHLHYHPEGHTHSHQHMHFHSHTHIHEETKTANLTPWILFTIFVLGPCEPLIPLLMYPAAKASYTSLFLVTSSFGIVTIATMTSIVFLTIFGLNKLNLKKIEPYSHALAGGTIFLSGLGMVFLGL